MGTCKLSRHTAHRACSACVQLPLTLLIPLAQVGNTIAGAVCMALMYCYAYGSIGKQLFKPVGKH